jgi:hypothetical protein
MKLVWGEEEYTVRYTRNERSGLACFKAAIWEMRRMRTRYEKRSCPIYRKEEDAIHTILKCSEARKWWEQLLVGNS